jgi:hypothetical protein
MSDLDSLRYPVGRFSRPAAPLGDEERGALIQEIARMPAGLRALVTGVSDAQLDTPYRPDGWTVRQVCHHVADSHVNAYIRMKLAATEDAPTIKPYAEARWAELGEAKRGPVEVSLDLLDALHFRWTAFLFDLPASDFRRTYVHPALGAFALDAAVALYAWHGRHHTAHVERVVGPRG